MTRNPVRDIILALIAWLLVAWLCARCFAAVWVGGETP